MTRKKEIELIQLYVDGMGFLPIVKVNGVEVHRGQYREVLISALEDCAKVLAKEKELANDDGEHNLTKKQLEFYDFVKTYIKEYGFSPTFIECQEYFGWKSPNAVLDKYQNLAEKGYLRKLQVRRGYTLGPKYV